MGGVSSSYGGGENREIGGMWGAGVGRGPMARKQVEE